MIEANSVKFKWDKHTLAEIEQKTLDGMYMMGVDIETEAKMRAPYLTGALSDSIRTLRLDNVQQVQVVAGGVGFGHKVPYALKREYGPNRNPTTVHYMQNSMNKVMTGNYMQKYFGEIAK